MRDIFIAKTCYKDIQHEFCFRPGNTPEETLKSALLQVQPRMYADRINRAQSNSRPKRKVNSKDTKLCYFCGNRFSTNQKQSCPARIVTCRNCSKKGHFAKCCHSKNLANVDAESDETTEEACNFITSDCESEFAILAVEGVFRTVKSFPIAELVKKLEVVNSATVKLSCIQITLRCNQTFFRATVDTRSPASFVNKRTAKHIVKSLPSAVVINQKEYPMTIIGNELS